MDAKLLREEALRETERSLAEKPGATPDPESEEWEAEYRRQFELLKRRHAAHEAAPEGALVAEVEGALPPLSGTAPDERWAAALRAGRLKLVRDEAMRAWLAQSWVSAKAWIDSRELAPAQFLQRIEAQYADAKRRAEARSGEAAAAAAERKAAADALARQVRAAGISPQSLIELVDLSERLKPAGLGGKLAEVSDDKRNLRVFLSDDSARLMVLEKNEAGERRQYAIASDDGLVADLKLYAAFRTAVEGDKK
ncbi:MAG: hypothetical protein ACREFQ_14155 [Stellaceae bacterium]